jgi:Domain of unknown function (DUF5679)
MLKRIFWLSVVAICGWLAWQWFRQRQGEFGELTPHFAPARPYTPPTPPAADPDETLAPAAPGEAPAAVDAPPPVELNSPEAPPPTIARHGVDELFAEDTPMPATEPAAAEAPAPVAPTQASAAQEVVGYCMRCRTKRPIKNAHEEISESGRRAARGTCPVCGTNMFVFLATSGEERGATT